MNTNRIEAFRTMLAIQPQDAMVWYGLANEYLKTDNLLDAIAALREVIRYNPEMTAAYQLLGNALVAQGDPTAAQQVWETGINVAIRLNQPKPRQHMEGLLAKLTPKDGFCQ
jgi:cytochrome c-type biogenesis protein CcmH/NrfG